MAYPPTYTTAEQRAALDKVRAEYKAQYGESPPDNYSISAIRESMESGNSISGNVQNAGGGVSVAPRRPGVPTAEGRAQEGVGIDDGDPETPSLTILTGDKMSWYHDPATGKWYVGYTLPNRTKTMYFEADPDQMDALFGAGMRPSVYTNKWFDVLMARGDAIFAGNISEMEGTGSFESEYQKVLTTALNNGSLPSWMAGDAKAEDLLFISIAENKSNDWLMEEFSKLATFQRRFPGLDILRKSGNLTVQDAVTAFLEFESGLRQNTTALGGAEAAITPEIVGGLLQKGWNLEAATAAQTTYKRMNDFVPAMDAFNQILVSSGKDPILTEQDYYDFMSGNAPSEYYDIYEASSVQEAAAQAGLGDVFSPLDAINAAKAGDYNRETATQAMQEASRLLLRLRSEIDYNKYDLNVDDLIDASLGLAPSSGLTEAELFDRVQRATLSAKSSLERRVNPYKGFASGGPIQSQSLGALRQQT